MLTSVKNKAINFKKKLAYGLYDGPAGVACYYLENFFQHEDPSSLKNFYTHLNRALLLEKVGKNFTPFLFGGSLGLTWLIYKASKLLNDPKLKEIFDIRHNKLSSVKSYLCGEGRYELVSGAVGIGVYALAVGDHDLLDDVLNYLENSLYQFEFGIGMRSPEDTSLIWSNDLKLDDKLNLGIAHGVAGVLLFLSYVDSLRARAIAKKIKQTFLNILSENCYPSKYPDVQLPIQNTWCYGDMGIGLSLLLASDNELERKKSKIIYERGRTKYINQKMKSDYLCHGNAIVKQMELSYSKFLNQKPNQEIIELDKSRTVINKTFIQGDLGYQLSHMSNLDSNINWESLFLLRNPTDEH